MLSRQLGDITMVGDVVIHTKQSCDQQPGSFIQDPGKPGYCTQGIWKAWIFYLKTGSSHTSQDKV